MDAPHALAAKRAAARGSGRLSQAVIGLERGLTDPVVKLKMGQTAEVLAHRFGITRQEMDAYAVESHRRLAKRRRKAGSRRSSRFDARESLRRDDGVRPETSVEQLARFARCSSRRSAR